MNDAVDQVLFHETTILSRLDEMAREISADYAGKELTVVAILHGSMIFMSDLLRRIDLPIKIESISVASYHGGTTSSGTVTFNQVNLPDIEGKHVLVLDDILDTGRTLRAILDRLMEEGKPESVKACVLLDKKEARVVEAPADYVGFEIGDEFVIGYGLDYRGHYRNLPFVGTIKPEYVVDE
jgi:hypoxanthine phosphoribosyltransferase